jgi:hypothetical protein
MPRRQYSGSAAAGTISVGINSAVLTITCNTLTGWPTGGTGPFAAVLERGTANEEKVLVASRSGNVLTLSSRGYDGTTARAHSASAPIEHCYTAVDADEANDHVNRLGDVHGVGVASQVVGTATTQTLLNKTINGANNTLTVPQAQVTGLSAAITAYDAHLAASQNVHGIGAGNSVVGTGTAQTLTSKTLTSPVINTPTIATPTITSPAITGGTLATPTITDPGVSINGGFTSGAWSTATLTGAAAYSQTGLTVTGTPTVTVNWRHRFLDKKTVVFQMYVNVSGGTIVCPASTGETVTFNMPAALSPTATYASQFLMIRCTDLSFAYCLVAAGGSSIALSNAAEPYNVGSSGSLSNIRIWGTLELS